MGYVRPWDGASWDEACQVMGWGMSCHGMGHHGMGHVRSWDGACHVMGWGIMGWQMHVCNFL